MPRADHAPDFVFETRNVPCKTNPLGVKGAGEAGAIGSCPAIMNAIIDALWRSLPDQAYRHAGDSPPHLGSHQYRPEIPNLLRILRSQIRDQAERRMVA